MKQFKGHFKSDEKEFIQVFKELCHSRQPWEVWQDLMTVMACAIVNAVDRTPERYEARESEYKSCIKRLGGVEKPMQLYVNVVNALETNPDQDYLGALYMQLELGNHWKGQFFTPYYVSRAMSEMLMGDCQKQIEQRGWISICDPCVGGGSMLIAAVSTLKQQNVYFHDHVLFVGQDIDRVVGMMAYIQISLLGCPGYIVIANSLTNPIVGDTLIPAEQKEQEFWYTPFYYSQGWQWRRNFVLLENMLIPRNTDEKAEDNIQVLVEHNRSKAVKLKKKSLVGQTIFDLFGISD